MQRSAINAVVTNGKLGTWDARVTAKQEAIILAVTKPLAIDAEDVAAYVASGDITHLPTATHDLLTKAVKQCQAKADSPSAARRFWPRKVAAVILLNRI